VERSSLSRVSPRPVVALSLAATASGLASILWWGFTGSWDNRLTWAFAAFTVFITLGDLLDVPLERRAAFSLALAPALGFALLRDCGDSASCTAPTTPQIGQVFAAFLLGTSASMVLRLIRKQDPRLTVAATRVLVVLSGAIVYRGVVQLVPDAWFVDRGALSLPGVLAVLVVVTGLDVLLETVVPGKDGARFQHVLRDQLRATAPLLVSSVSIGALLALAYPTLDVWTLPLFIIPLAATQYSFQQVASVRKNYLQTVAALAKVPEMAGYTPRDHSKRVARLSVAIAVELGVGQGDLQEIEYAALLHDIGRISLPDPEEAAKSTSDLQLALVGAEIINEAGHFPIVARMVRDQHEPYRRPGEDVNRALPLGAKILRVASAYDDLVNPSGPGHPAWDALDKLHLGMAYDFDPAVIQALTRVLEREGAL
jgi:putative nucleotidyltransferase with HDIG domain